MIIGIDSNVLIALILLCIFLIIGMVGLYFTLKKNAPDAFVHWKAKRKGLPVCRVHYRGKRAVDYIAEQDPLEKNMGTPYWIVPDVGIKFKPSADDIEIIEGSIACANYYTNLTESMSIATVVAFSQLKNWFGKHKIPIDTIEDIALTVAADYINTGDKERAIANAKIDSEKTKEYLQKYLDVIDSNATELDRMKLESGVFTFQTAMKALDSVVAWSSSHAEHMKKVVRAAAMREAEDANAQKRNLIMYAIVAFIICIGAAAFLLATKGR